MVWVGTPLTWRRHRGGADHGRQDPEASPETEKAEGAYGLSRSLGRRHGTPILDSGSAGGGEGAKPFGESQVLAIVDWDFDERRTVVVEGLHQARIELVGG